MATAHVNGICGPYGCHCPFDYPLQSPNAQFLVTKRVLDLPGSWARKRDRAYILSETPSHLEG